MKPQPISQMKYSPDRYLEELSGLFGKEYRDEREDFRKRVNELVSIEGFEKRSPKFVQMESNPNMILIWTGEELELANYIQNTLWGYNVVQSQSGIYVFDRNTGECVKEFLKTEGLRDIDLRYVDQGYFGNPERQGKKQGVIVAYSFPRNMGVHFFDENFENTLGEFDSVGFCNLKDKKITHWGRKGEQYYLIKIEGNNYEEIKIGEAMEEKGHQKYFIFEGETIGFNEFGRLVRGKNTIENVK